MALNIRVKGQSGEREVIDLLQPIVSAVCAEAGRAEITLQRNTLQSDSGGSDIAGLPMFAIEVKRQEKDFDPAWWRQCLDQSKAHGGAPVLFYRRSRRPWRVRLRVCIYTGKVPFYAPADISVEDFLAWFELRLRVIFARRK